MRHSEADEQEPVTEDAEGSELTPKQEGAVFALLTNLKIEDAAREAKVSRATLHRWLKQPHFAEAVKQGRLRVLDAATMKLRTAADDAVETLKRNLYCGQAGPEIRAAQIILETAYKSAELEEMEQRITALEELLQEKEAAGAGGRR